MAKLTDMAAFIAVVEFESFSQAGRELRVSTAVVSARVAKLEKQIGVRLLNRTTRHVVPTDEALIYYQDCKQILQQVEMAEAALSSRREHPVGNLKITAPLVFGRRHLAPLLPAFQQDYPDLQIRLHLTDGFVDLLKEGIDLAIRIADLPDSTMVARKLGDSPRVICASEKYLQKAGTPKVPEDLLNHECLLLRFPGSTQFQWRFGSADDALTVPVRGSLDSNNGDVIRDWALAGYGICMKSRWEIEKELEEGQLIELLTDFQPQPVTISAIYPQGKIVPPKVRLFIDYLAKSFRAGF